MRGRAARKRGSTVASTPDADAAFWKILTSNIDASKAHATAVDLHPLGKNRIQLFEFLVTETLARLSPEFTWRVTGVSGDGGIDLQGDGKRHHYLIGAVNLTMTYVVIGQVKRSASYSRSTASDIIDRLVLRGPGDATPVTALSHLLVVISGRTTKVSDDYREQLSIKGGRHLPGVPLTVMDAEEFVRLWSADPQWVESTIDAGLPAYQLAVVIDYLRARRRSESHGWTIVVSPAAGSRMRGSILELRVTVKAPRGLPRRHIALAWCPGPDIQIVRPGVAVGTDGAAGRLRFVLDDDGAVDLRLRFYTHADGDVAVGHLDIVEGAGWREGTGTDPPALPLGSVRIARETLDFNDVPYVPDAQRSSATRLELALKRAATGRVEAFALVGGAGIGKTRLVENIADRLQVAASNDTPAPAFSFTEPISISHETELSGSRRLIRDLALTLAGLRIDARGTPLGDDGAALGRWLKNWLRRHTRDAETEIDDAIAMLMSDAYAEQAWFRIAFLLVICVLARSSNGPVFLHLANLHWADAFELRVVAEFIRRLREPGVAAPNGIVIVLEGRTGEMSDDEGRGTTDSWRALYESGDVQTIELKTWSAAESERFLELVLRPMTGARPGFDPFRVDPRWRALREHVLRTAAGNPMQMLEYLRTLREEGVLIDDGHGALVVAQDAAMVDLGKKVLSELVFLRVRYLQDKPENGALISLLRVLAEIGLTVDRDTFDAVATAVKNDGDLWRLRRFYVARVPANDDRDFEFVHETYRRAFRDLDWSGDDAANRIRAAALEELSPRADSNLGRVIAWARLMRLSDSYDRSFVSDTLLAALQRSGQAQDQSAVVRLCDELLKFGDDVLGAASHSRDRLRMRRAEALMGSGNWADALAELAGLATELPQRAFGFDADLFQAEIANDRGNVLGDQMRCADGIVVVCEGLRIVRRAATERITPELVRCEASLSNRLGVLHWFSGRANVGMASQWHALHSARRHEPGGIGEITFLCEVGTVLLHRHPKWGRELLARSMSLIKQVEWPPSSVDYIASQYAMACLLDPSSGSSPVEVEHCAHAIASGHGQRAPSIYCASLGWMTAGAAAFVDGRWADAYVYLSEAVTFSMRARSDRVVWKARLGLATVLGLLGDEPAAAVHAREAARILIASLDAVGDDARPDWAAMIRLPLEHARRIAGDSDEELRRCLSEVDGGRPPAWISAWPSRPVSRSRAGEAFQVLHVRNGDDDVFLMG
jgi:hypothetical protein